MDDWILPRDLLTVPPLFQSWDFMQEEQQQQEMRLKPMSQDEFVASTDASSQGDSELLNQDQLILNQPTSADDALALHAAEFKPGPLALSLLEQAPEQGSEPRAAAPLPPLPSTLPTTRPIPTAASQPIPMAAPVSTSGLLAAPAATPTGAPTAALAPAVAPVPLVFKAQQGHPLWRMMSPAARGIEVQLPLSSSPIIVGESDATNKTSPNAKKKRKRSDKIQEDGTNNKKQQVDDHVSPPQQPLTAPENDKKPPRNENRIVLSRDKMNKSELIRFNYHKKFLRENLDVADRVVSVIDRGKIKTSLRVFEHLITNFCKKHNLRLDKDGNEAPDGYFFVRDEYKKKLPKTVMDPCCRGPRVMIEHRGELVETTLPQLNCVIWICTTPIYNYCIRNFEVIKQDLNRDKNLLPRKKDISAIKLPEPKPTPAYQLLVKSGGNGSSRDNKIAVDSDSDDD